MEQRFVAIAGGALKLASRMVVAHQHDVWRGRVVIKDDGSLLTPVDSESERIITEHLREEFPDVPILREEAGLLAGHDGRYVILIDPVDGTRSLVAGAATSTIIASLYDREFCQVVAVVIAAPATGRIWSAVRGHGCTLTIGQTEQSCRVWDGDMRPSSTLMIDRFSAFTRNGRTILTDDNYARLFCQLHTQASIKSYGSNGLHHALVANGSPDVAGAVTTAVGGAWDCGGVLLVLEAGGAACGFAMDKDGRLTEHDPLDVLKHDLMIVAKSRAALEELTTALAYAV